MSNPTTTPNESENRAREIARTNAAIAIDQVREYDSEREAFNAYVQNAFDSCDEEKLGADVWAIVVDEFRSEFERLKSDGGFRVGDGVNWSQGSDCVAGTVVRVTDASVYVVEDEAKLLNGIESGEPDALHFSPGGFVGHTSGRQRYEFSPGSGAPRRFTFRRNTGRFKLAGASTRGSMAAWGHLRHGRQKHCDYNF